MEGHASQASQPEGAVLQAAAPHQFSWSSPPVGGLLALWTIGLVLFPIRFATNFYDTSLPFLGLRPCHASLGAALHLFPEHAAFFVLGVALEISQLCAWLALFSAYFARSSSTRRLMVAFLALGIARSLLTLIVPGATVKGHEREGATVAVLTLWLPYVLLSERIRTTFVRRPVSPLTSRAAIGGFVALSLMLCGLSVRSYVSFDPVAFARSTTPSPAPDRRREFETEVSSTSAIAVAFTTDLSTKIAGSRGMRREDRNVSDPNAPSRLRAAAARPSPGIDRKRYTRMRE
jgi:hypothetical protein